MSPQALDSSEVTSFEQDAAQVLLRLRKALSAIIKAADPRAERACDVSDVFKIHAKLGWQVAKVAHEPHLLSAGRYVPTARGLRAFLKAARSRVADDLVRDANSAMEEFERLVRAHAGSREAFDVMLAGCAGTGGEGVHLSQRKTWFTAASFTWGVQAKAQIDTNFLHPSKRPGWFDLAYFKGLVELHRVRSDVSWPIGCSKRVADDGSAIEQPQREPLDAGLRERAAGVPLLTPFCSEPMPTVRRMPVSGGYVRDEIVEGPAGRTAALDCFTGEVWREIAPTHRTEHDWLWYASAQLWTPCEVLILDQFVHEDVFGPIRPELHVYRDLPVGPRAPIAQRAGDRIPVFETVEHLGRGIAAIHTPDVPRYAEMVRYTFERLGWDPRRFDVFRVRIEYPPVPTTVTMESPLPEPPNQSPERERGVQ